MNTGLNCPRTLLGAILAAAMLFGSGPAVADQRDEIELMTKFLDVMHRYYGLVRELHEISSTPASSMVLELQKLDELYKDLGDRDKSIAVLREVFEKTDDPIVRNATAILLSEALKETGRARQAAEVLEKTIREKL